MQDHLRRPSENEGAFKALLLETLIEISSSVGPLAKQDQRFGASVLYQKREFVDLTIHYHVALQRLLVTWSENAFIELRDRIVEFVEYVNDLFPNDRQRMLTTLRQRLGGSFSLLYKQSVAALKLMEHGFPGSKELERFDLPEQKSSPIYTKIEGNRLVLDRGHSLHPLLRQESISETRGYLTRELNELADSLRSSNVDRKYVDTFAKLVYLIDFNDDSGAITFGLHARQVSRLTSSIEHELSDIQSAKISAALTHAAYFSSQYKDWVDFVRNAQNYPSREEVDGQIDEALRAVTEVLAESQETVDAQIPESIDQISTLLDSTSDDRINAIYAGIRGVENICIAAIRHAYDQAILLLQDSGKAARPTIVRIGAAAIIGVALKVIATFMPVILSASELNWILENLSRIEKLGHILK
ncbi:hypothetical protein [Rhodopseudomonas sp.]|uniref:hypothetical protein n=1 Tax=Rhodopseudomonas sp. TaxID=1078 RepID=UPI0039E52C56